MNEFGKHIAKDPEVWPLAVITAGTAAYGMLLTLSKYYEAVPKLPFPSTQGKKSP